MKLHFPSQAATSFEFLCISYCLGIISFIFYFAFSQTILFLSSLFSTTRPCAAQLLNRIYRSTIYHSNLWINFFHFFLKNEAHVQTVDSLTEIFQLRNFIFGMNEINVGRWIKCLDICMAFLPVFIVIFSVFIFFFFFVAIKSIVSLDKSHFQLF